VSLAQCVSLVFVAAFGFNTGAAAYGWSDLTKNERDGAVIVSVVLLCIAGLSWFVDSK
jgi:hypothetical protein